MIQKTLPTIGLCQFFQYFRKLLRESCTIEFLNTQKYAILQLINDISSSFERGEYKLGIFIDLPKLFDAVDHEILISQLEYYGIKGKTLNWLESYLNERMQSISYSNVGKTSLCSIIFGVPQGSILGPLLFLILVNDLLKASSILKPVIFANDTNLLLSNKDQQMIL